MSFVSSSLDPKELHMKEEFGGVSSWHALSCPLLLSLISIAYKSADLQV